MKKNSSLLSMVLCILCAVFFSGFKGGAINTPIITMEKSIPITGNIDQLKYFLNALKDSKNRKVRIAHWGDSIILGDVLSDSFRRLLQKEFGGSGVGFVSLVPEDFPMRLSTIVNSSGDWDEASIFKRNPDKLPLGINASVYRTTSEKSWVTYDVGKYNKSVKNYNSLTLFYTNGNGSAEVKISTNTGYSQTTKLVSGSSVKKISVSFPTPATTARIEFNSCKNVLFYGVSFENSHGVYLDNFPVKGNNGIGLQEISAETLRDFKSHLDYKLIILNFGVNVLSPEHKEYTWYLAKMEKVVAHLQNAFPNTSILIVSTGDKAVKKGGKFVSEPVIGNLLKAQEELANRTGVAFWNLFEAMGGKNSIVDWVSQSPALAYKDYCHFTPDGGDKVAELLNAALLKLMSK